MVEKILILRFSSFGDVVQTLSVPAAIKTVFPNSEISWITRLEFSALIENHPLVKEVISVSRKDNLLDLIKLSYKLSSNGYTHLYDAHRSQRSIMISFFIRLFSLIKLNQKPNLLNRSIRRWKRFLLFNFRINRFEQPFSGQRDLIEPLSQWGCDPRFIPEAPQIFFNQSDQKKTLDFLSTLKQSPLTYICLAPSAAFTLKRWPKAHFLSLIDLLQFDCKKLGLKIICLGGKEDTFIQDFENEYPDLVINLAGKLSLIESSIVIKFSKGLISNDTGLLHVAEQLGHPTVALMGPAPFGFPCRRSSTVILERQLACRPCSKHGQGPCQNSNFQACLTEIKPKEVYESLQKLKVI